MLQKSSRGASAPLRSGDANHPDGNPPLPATLIGRRSLTKSLTDGASLSATRAGTRWPTFTSRGWQAAKQQRRCCTRTRQLFLDELKRKLTPASLNSLPVPPGSAKSTYASILFPPWLLASANWNILAASHTTELAEKWGRRIRNLVSEHSTTLGISLAADSQAAGRWSLDSGAEYYAAGVGTGIAGFRAKLGLIDDPIRSRQDADSELIRDRIWDWYIRELKREPALCSDWRRI